MDKKEARSVLGVNKDASNSDIEKRYAVLLKKYRVEINRLKDAANAAEKEEIDSAEVITDDTGAVTDPDIVATADTESSDAQQTSTAADSVGPDGENTDEDPEGPETAIEQLEAELYRITEAYNVLMGYETKEEEELPGKTLPLLGVNEKKAKNFLHYYKFHILVFVLLIVSIIYSVQGCVNRVKPDFNAAFIGRIGYYEATEALSDSVKESIPIIEEPGFDGAYIDKTISGDQLYAMEMKLTVLFGAADIDVFILDREYYDRFAKQGLFKNLDDIAPRLGADVIENQDLVVAIENHDEPVDVDGPAEGTRTDTAEEPHLYGIDVSNSTTLKEAGVVADDMVAAIFLGTKQQEKAEAFLRFLLK
ncbi:MAG: hypothetical protein GX279_01670 [Clostridiaceae bacterium]|jgi:hypothetical protein|nr:hypothetical protein [Clostridiaceae bacterium]